MQANPINFLQVCEITLLLMTQIKNFKSFLVNNFAFNKMKTPSQVASLLKNSLQLYFYDIFLYFIALLFMKKCVTGWIGI